MEHLAEYFWPNCWQPSHRYHPCGMQRNSGARDLWRGPLNHPPNWTPSEALLCKAQCGAKVRSSEWAIICLFFGQILPQRAIDAGCETGARRPTGTLVDPSSQRRTSPHASSHCLKLNAAPATSDQPNRWSPQPCPGRAWRSSKLPARENDVSRIFRNGHEKYLPVCPDSGRWAAAASARRDSGTGPR